MRLFQLRFGLIGFCFCFMLGTGAPAADTDGDGVDDVGGKLIYSTSFDTVGTEWTMNSWTRVDDALNAHSSSWHVNTICSGADCSKTFSMTLTITLPQASTVSFWAKSTSNTPTALLFLVDDGPDRSYSLDKYAYKILRVVVPTAGAHTFKWTDNKTNDSFYIDDVSIITAPDNCPTVYNPDQHDTDNDGLGDACDESNDGNKALEENPCL